MVLERLKKIPLVVAVGLVLTFGCFLLYMNNPPFIQTLSFSAYDAFMKGVQEPPKSDAVVLIDIDERSLNEYGQWPWSRDLIAMLTQKILDGGAAVVAFDVVFAEPDGKSPEVMRSVMDKRYGLDVKIAGIPDDLVDFDRMFADTLRSASDRTILGCFMNPSTGTVLTVEDNDPHYRGYFFYKGPQNHDYRKFCQRADKMTISIPILNEAAGNNAFYNAMPDNDNVVRRNPLVMAYGDSRTYPSLAIEAVRMALGIKKIGVFYSELGIEWLRLEDIVIPTDGAGRLIVNFRKIDETKSGAVFRSFPAIAAADMLNGTAPAGGVSNKIVFVGTSAPGLRDIRATPLTPEFSGVEVHATIVDNILAGDMLIQPTWSTGVDVFAIVLVGIFLTFLIHRGKAVLSFLVTLLLLTIAVKVSYMLFDKQHFVFVPVRLIVSTVIIYPVLTMIKYWQEEMQKRQVRNMFGTMVSHEVLRYLEHNPESFSVGRKAEATMFFSDVAGFTTISETLDAGKLSDLLNAYLSPMTQVIMDRMGYVDKYAGDGIMAEWGVPFSLDDHASQGCLAALEQQEALARIRPILKAEFGHELHVRMGLNSGTVSAGNMGSNRRKQFTVMGDAVNLAARLEPVNKDYGTQIIASEFTFEKARAKVEGRLLDKIVVVGKGKPVCIYEIMARAGGVTPEQAKFRELYESGLRLHWEQKWDDAVAVLEMALKIMPGDKASREIIRRVAEYRISSLPSTWAGEYVRTSKH